MRLQILNKIFKILVIILIISSCENPDSSEVNRWHKERIERLESPYNWLSLTGFYWLNNSVTTLGSIEGSDYKLESDFKFQDTITLGVDPKIINNGKQSRLLDTIIQRGSIQYFLIERNNRWAIRVKDSLAKSRINFTKIERFEYNPELIVQATYSKLTSDITLEIENYQGYIEQQTVSGKLEFSIKGKKHTLYPIEEGDSFFIIFADKTNENDSYPTGRFLYAEKKSNGEKVKLDFNRAYNLPCAFTEFATCPIPPAENYLDFRVEAGEKKYGKH
jgi:uncharacterized protein (DUF1684 family)